MDLLEVLCEKPAAEVRKLDVDQLRVASRNFYADRPFHPLTRFAWFILLLTAWRFGLH